MVRTPLLPIVAVDTNGGVGAVGVTVTATDAAEVKVVVDPLVLTLEVFRVPRLQVIVPPAVLLGHVPGVGAPLLMVDVVP
jgi:hypothetical protein